MKIFVDENIPLETIESLTKMGHDVLDIRGTDKEGIPDEEIWKIVLEEKRLLISTDKGLAVGYFIFQVDSLLPQVDGLLLQFYGLLLQ